MAPQRPKARERWRTHEKGRELPAREPEQLHGLFEHAFNAGDIEALMALYEPDAALIPQPGVTVEGSAAIGERFAGSSTAAVISRSIEARMRVGDLAYWRIAGR